MSAARARVVLGVGAAVLLAGCGAEAAAPPPTSTATAPAVTVTADPRASVRESAATGPAGSAPNPMSDQPSDPGPTPSPSPTTMTKAQLDSAFAELSTELSGATGLAIVPVGGGAVLTAGPEQRDLAWSTMKVPIAVAALQEDDDEHTRALARRAVTVSDNDAVQQLWQQLGGGWSAARKVDTVLADGGDPETSIAAVLTPRARSRYGGTPWELDGAAAFAAHLPCRPGTKTVLDLMGQVEPGQRWGIGTIDGARFKGGWGPQNDGFVARQIGVVPTRRGHVGVAVVSRTTAGMGVAVRDLDRIAGFLRANAHRLPAGRCP